MLDTYQFLDTFDVSDRIDPMRCYEIDFALSMPPALSPVDDVRWDFCE